jgi:hypothetical protein
VRHPNPVDRQKTYVATLYYPEGTKVYPTWPSMEGAVLFALRWANLSGIKSKVEYNGQEIVSFDGVRIHQIHGVGKAMKPKKRSLKRKVAK